MKKIVITLLLAFAGNVSATAQMGDILLHKGETLPIFSNPLESYFNEQHPRPKDIFKFSCTANWRGYVATWEIKEQTLYLVKLIEGGCSQQDATEIPLTKIFTEQQVPIKATWFSGILRIPLGKILEYVHMGYGSIYEKELFLTLKDGVVVSEKIIDNSKKDLPTTNQLTIEELRKLQEWEDTVKR